MTSDHPGTSEAPGAGPARVPHMSAEDFRAVGRRMVDAIADYWETLESRPVRGPVAPGEILASLPRTPPADGIGGHGRDPAAWDAFITRAMDLVVPGLTNWQHPGFMAYFPANASFPAILGEMMSAGLGVQGMLWATSPACTEIELGMLDWLAHALDLPARFRLGGDSESGASGGPGSPRSSAERARHLMGVLGGSIVGDGTTRGAGVIQGTASEATLVAMVAARHRARLAGARDEALVAYASTQAHSSVVKAAMILGLARDAADRSRLRLIDVDDRFAMRADLLMEAMAEDVRGGRVPFFVAATLGTTGSTAIDPLPTIHAGIDGVCGADVGSRGGGLRPWVHVDGAHGGAMLILPEHAAMRAGLDRADSFCMNPHKWLLTNFDCDCFWTADAGALAAALSITPEYLRHAGTGQAPDLRDWQVPLGRRFRALKLWFVMAHYGIEGLRTFVREHVAWSAWLEDRLRVDARFEVVAPRTMNLVCFRPRGSSDGEHDARARSLLESINAGGEHFLTHTTLPLPDGAGGRREAFVLRACVGGTMTREHHVASLWNAIRVWADAHG